MYNEPQEISSTPKIKVIGVGGAGNNAIKNSKLENLKTNMLLIEAKARECVEEANFRMGATTDETVVESVRKEIVQMYPIAPVKLI